MTGPEQTDPKSPWSRRLPRARGWVSGLACLVVLALTTPGFGSVSSASVVSQPPSSSDYLVWSPCCSWGETWSYDMFNSDALGIADGLVDLPLASEEYPSLTKFAPELASKWSLSARNLTVDLRKDARWQDGSPVTSTDVYDTLVLLGTEGAGGMPDIASMRIVSPHRIVITIRSGVPTAIAEDNIFGVFPVPSKVYGHFVSHSLYSDEVAYYAKSSSDPNAAAKMPQYKRMGQVFTKVASAKVPKLIGDGPFELKAITTQEARLVKSPKFYLANRVHIAGIDYLDNENNQIYPELFSGSADFSNVYLPPVDIAKWKATPGSATALPLSFDVTYAMNSHRYPLSITKVRQALAYLIPREKMNIEDNGSSFLAGGTLDTRPAGIPNWVESEYLSKSQLHSLNAYPYDPAKAKALLESVGFKKSHGKWDLPNGKPFTLSYSQNSSEIAASDRGLTESLTAFGIRTTLNSVPGAALSADQFDGDFDITAVYIGGVDPLTMYASVLSGMNFINSGSYAGKRGIGFGPRENVPGLGVVNVPHTIGQQALTVGPGPKMRRLTWGWARLVNQDVPYLSWTTKRYQFEFSTKRFKDWPPMNAKHTSTLWNIMGMGNFNVALEMMLQRGYIRPRS